MISMIQRGHTLPRGALLLYLTPRSEYTLRVSGAPAPSKRLILSLLRILHDSYYWYEGIISTLYEYVQYV